MAEPGDRIPDDPESSQNKSWFDTWWKAREESASELTEEVKGQTLGGPILKGAGLLKDAFGVAFGSGNLGSNLSSGVKGMDVVARGGAWNEAKIKDYDEKAAKNSLLGSGTGVIASPVMAGLVVADKVWTYGVARPASTAALVDRKYRNQDMEWDTLRKAWNRSEDVSFGQAAIPDEVVSLISNVEEYDPWSNYDLSDLSSNPVFNLMSGSIDGTLNLVGPPIAKIGRLKVISRTTGGTTVKSSRDLAALREDYNSHSRFRMQSEKAPIITSIDEVSNVGVADVGNDVIANSLVRDAQEAGIKLDGPRGADTYATGIFDFRSDKLLKSDPSLKTIGSQVDLTDDVAYAAYMKMFYPQLTDDTTITLYRGLKGREDVFKTTGGVGNETVFTPGFGSHWTTNPIVANGFGGQTKVVSIEVRFGDIKKYQMGSPDDKVFIGPTRGSYGGEDAIVLDYNKMPQGLKDSVKEVDIVTPEGSVNPYDGLNKLMGERPAASGKITEASEILSDRDLINSGSRTTYGEMVFDIAEETRPEALRLNPIVANSHSLDKAAFADLLARTDDPNTVNNLILVSRGDELAFKELEEAADPALWVLGDMNSQIQANAIAGNRYAPTGAALAKVNQMFDNQLRKSENADYFEKVMRIFRDPSGNMRGSSEFMPSRRFTVEKIRKGGRKGQYAFQYADYSDAPQWIKVASESGLGKPVTSFMQWVGGRKPLGLVSRSGVRPNELAVEFESMMNSVPEFRGTRVVKVLDGNLDVVEVPASEWRKGMYAKIEAVTDDVELETVWREMENETIEVMARGLDVSAEQVQQIVKAFQQSTDTIVENMTRNGGYIFDEISGRELLDPVSLRQFMNSFTTVNMGEVRRAVQMSRGSFRKYGEQGADIGTTIFDLGMKIFRTDVLFRIGYTPKNAVWEPLQASMLAHGVILADEGISSTAGKFVRNRKNQALHLAYRADVMNKIKQIFPGGSKTNKQLNKDMEVLLEERAKIKSAIDLATNDFAATTRDLTSPGLKQSQLEDIAGQLSRSARELEAVEQVMDGITPAWRQVPDVVNVKEINRRTREYRAILGEDQSYADDLASDTNGVLQEQAVVLGSPRIQTDLEIENLKNELVHVEEERVFLAEERLNEIGVAESGAQGVGSRPLRERIDPTTIHPDLPPSKNTGLVGISFVEKFLEDIKLTPDQRMEASDLGNVWQSAGSINKPLVVQWDDLTNRVYIDPAGDGVVELAAMKAAGFDSIPVTVVTKKVPEGNGIELPSGKWLTDNPGTGGSRRSAPKELHPDEIFPVQYGAIDNGRVVGTPASPSRANDFDGDLARGRDYRATANERQKKNLERALAEKERLAATQKLPDAFTADEIIPTLTSGNKARISANNKTIERIRNSKNLDPEARKEIETMANRLEETMEEIRQINLSPGLRPVSQILEEKTAMLENIQKRIEALSPKIGERKKKIEEVSSKLSWEGSGDGYMTIMIGGVKTRQPAAFNNEGYNMGAGYRAEASAARTSQTTWDPSAAISALDHHMTRTGQVKSLAPNEPGYWEELAYVIKAHFRGDRFIQKILEGDSDTDLMVWLNSREGRIYQKDMNKNYTLTNTNYINNTNVISDFGNEAQKVIRLVKQYIPDENVRKRAAAGELGAGDLQAAMGGRDDLGRILSSELEANVGTIKNIGRMISKGADRFWQGIATTPEDRLARWPFYQMEFKTQLQRMVDVREIDGVSIPLSAVEPMRQAAHRMALDELEKTFYTIRRYNNAVYMARFLTGFPGAMFNSVYRYGRFAAKEPERLIQTGNIYGSALATFGVDEEGNEVKNISDAKYLVIPGTSSKNNPDGARVPLYFMDSIAVGAPSLSYGAAIAVSTAYAANPATEEFLQDIMGDDLYELTFPYGVQANPAKNILSSYQKSALSAIRQFDDEAFLKASVNLHAHNMAEWEKNGSDIDLIPDYDKAQTDTRNYFILRLGVKFADSFSTEIPNVTKVPGQFMRDELRRTRERFPDTDEGRENAAVAFISKYGEWAEWYTKSVKKYRVYVPSTQDAYNRLWKEFPDLTEKLVKLDPDDPFMVSLFATGTDAGDFSQSVFNAFKTDPLPGDTKLISETMTPLVFDNRYKVEEGWDLKKKSKAILDAELVRLRTLRDAAETKPKEQEFYRSEILNVTTQYNDWLQKLEDSNEPFAASQTSFAVTENADRAALYLDKILEHKPFMDTVKDDPTWIALNDFMKSRKNTQKAIEKIEDDKDGSKKDGIIIKYLTFVRDKYSSDVEFDAIWERYFVDEYTVDNAELETE